MSIMVIEKVFNFGDFWDTLTQSPKNVQSILRTKFDSKPSSHIFSQIMAILTLNCAIFFYKFVTFIDFYAVLIILP